MATTYTWTGKHPFSITGAAIHEDTLRIKANYREMKKPLHLELPTLCITYADVKFQNAIGGEQANFPDSQPYGPTYFDPPITLSGEAIERLTYIRGALKVTIGPDRTVIEFPAYKELVIPRMRLDKKNLLNAVLAVPQATIAPQTPLAIDVRQFADGRHVGGVRIEKRHPDWKPPQIRKVYELVIHVFDGVTGRPKVKTPVDIFSWDPGIKTPYGKGAMVRDTTLFTDRTGHIRVTERPAEELEAYGVRLTGYRSVVRCLRPLSGQKVHLHLRLWPLTRTLVPYVYKKDDTLESLAALCGNPATLILEVNQIKSAADLKTGARLILPCHVAAYRMESWDTLDSVARMFGYKNARQLAKVMGLKAVAEINPGNDIILPGWFFVNARATDTLDSLDKRFNMKAGSCKPIGKVYRPNKRTPYPGESIAVPCGGGRAGKEKPGLVLKGAGDISEVIEKQVRG
jgi:hypothetical protein